ncbi:C6 transcription factor, putative [Talaromyces stipitatus ATCC 10500]|uniref:C6 transcription factor, putative n=1 Tax=Talaromyces stipitatus (strain ATCC 10500 / CBS 375.48 / QM 6759 / NRRL 1006) TaxID=441959 RepID=B8LYS1_TALSN|nr:C6 transcription factor, putative [Talaromyces stipitatus ATCC 10500]EED23429.1 C6 transcription factor, putative [Talaromyces stipitatus ATCC 10500]
MQDNNKLAGQKRKASETLTAERRKITRACDSCKLKKTRCSGTLPCHRCTKLSRTCQYNATYTRGTPPSPLPAPGSTHRQDAVRRSTPSVRSSIHTGPVSPKSSLATSSPTGSHFRRSSHSLAVLSPRSSSPEPEATDLEGNYLGPSSGISFLSRSWRRLKQDNISTTPRLPENERSKNTPVLLFGDRPFSDKADWSSLELPPKDRAIRLLDTYFDFSIVTYRFLHRGNVMALLDTIYEKNILPSNPPPSHSAAKVGVIYMIFAVGMLGEERRIGNDEIHPESESERWYAAARHMMSIETGPPALETIQVRLGICLFLLSSSRANQCWYMFGTTMQLVTALGLHRRRLSKTTRGGPAYVEQELRKRIFWSAYTLDKYLSVMFGRPRLLDDEDIDQDFPDEVNDEDMFLEKPPRIQDAMDGMMIASILHFRLGLLMGEISRRVYPTKAVSTVAPYEAAIELVAELQEWKQSVHPLFGSVRASSLIPPLCRQSHVLQFAYDHAMIHATRLFILNDFTDLTRRPLVPLDLVTTHVQNCINAVRDVLQRVDALADQGSMLESWWFTHYICFCAILVAYIYTIQQHQSSTSDPITPSTSSMTDDVQDLFSLAERCQIHLAKATRKNCPSRRYGIILEELRLEVHRQLSIATINNINPSQPQMTEVNTIQQGLQLDKPYQTDTNFEQPTVNTNPDLDGYPYLGNSAIPGMEGPDLLGGDDFGLLNSLDGSVWWTQLDSWAYSSLNNDSSEFNF